MVRQHQQVPRVVKIINWRKKELCISLMKQCCPNQIITTLNGSNNETSEEIRNGSPTLNHSFSLRCSFGKINRLIESQFKNQITMANAHLCFWMIWSHSRTNEPKWCWEPINDINLCSFMTLQHLLNPPKHPINNAEKQIIVKKEITLENNCNRKVLEHWTANMTLGKSSSVKVQHLVIIAAGSSTFD